MDPDRTVTFDPAEHPPMERQFMLSQLVVPRPIAMVSTRSPTGVANIAPMSYYLPITGDPMLLGITMGLRETGELKDTYNNAMASGDFVVNVTWPTAIRVRFSSPNTTEDRRSDRFFQ